MPDCMNPGMPRRSAVRGLFRAAASIAPVLVAILMAAPAEAACTVSGGTTLACTGDLSGGVYALHTSLNILDVNTLTTDVGARGIFFSSDADLNVLATIDLSSTGHEVNTDPASGARTIPMGVHVIGRQGVGVDIEGDVTAAVGPNETVTNATSVLHDHVGAVRVTSTGDGDVGLTFNGNLDVTMPTLDVSSTFVGAANTGLFAGINTFAHAANTTVKHTGTLTIKSGDVSVDSTDATGDNRAIAAATTTAPQFQTYGVYAVGAGDYTLHNTGAITVTGAKAIATASSNGGRAEAIASSAESGGVVLDRLIDGGSIFNVSYAPRLDNVEIVQIGDVSIASGDSIATATATTLPSGDPAEAVAVVGEYLVPDVGVEMANGVHLTGRIDGNVTVLAGAAEASADATLGEPEGNVIAYAQGRNVIGVSARSPAYSDPDVPTSGDITINGDITVAGGAASATAHGTGPAIERESGFPPSGTDPSNYAAIAWAGNAIGFSAAYYDFDTFTYDITSNIRADGGDATADITGANLRPNLLGGNASALVITGTGTFGAGTTVEAYGGDASASLTGTDLVASVTAGDGRGVLNYLVDGSSGSTAGFPITARGGDATVTGSAADGSYAQGGGGAGLNVSNYFRTSVPVPADRSYTFTGAVVATGGDASAPPGTSAIGGPATGILAAGGLNFISEGTVVATAGSGNTRNGYVQGIVTQYVYAPGYVDTSVLNGALTIRNTVAATGEGIDVADQAPFYNPFDLSATVSGGVVSETSWS